MPSFMYPRTVDIKRAAGVGANGGVKGYGGLDPKALTVVATGVAANIQAKGQARANPNGLPGATIPATWNIHLPAGLVAAGVIRDRDLVFDDLGRVFQITADYVHSMGWRLTCDRLEA